MHVSFVCTEDFGKNFIIRFLELSGIRGRACVFKVIFAISRHTVSGFRKGWAEISLNLMALRLMRASLWKERRNEFKKNVTGKTIIFVGNILILNLKFYISVIKVHNTVHMLFGMRDCTCTVYHTAVALIADVNCVFRVMRMKEISIRQRIWISG